MQFHSLKPAILSLAIVAAYAAPSAMADTIKVAVTVDNSYALFLGNGTSATSFVGSDFNWPTTESYTFELPKSSFIYVVTASDLSVAQGFLGQFENLTTGYKFYSSDIQWQVMATGLGNSGAPYSGSAADLALLTKEVQDANAGGNASNGWVPTTAGDANGASPWGARPDIDAAAHWVWYNKPGSGITNPTIGGYNHDEWLVFRVGVAATPAGPAPVPEPAAWALMGVGLLCVGWNARRRSAPSGRA